MNRTDGDSWDVVTSVGATALMVSAMRAIEARKDSPLAIDEYAQLFVDATRQTAPIFSELVEVQENFQHPDVRSFSSVQGARTRYFDEFLSEAVVTTGTHQVVILASGLDTRGYRLRWPEGTTLYELDLPKVLEFKQTVLAEHSVSATTEIRHVPIDLREDWPVALTVAGFDKARPTVWLAEGLLPFLPGNAQDLLLEQVTALSAPGSQFGLEDFAPADHRNQFSSDAPIDGPLRRMFDVVAGPGAPPSALWYWDRGDAEAWLDEHDWSVRVVNMGQLFGAYGETPSGHVAFARSRDSARYLTARTGY
ncbi:SAM-dependent methyltransferase [Mycobacteroides chelonae]|uniref:SAM-dependent methyltransferase n=1 Tax=Mycobacteroides chelonae TaxID=1774 RepID=UPI0012FFAD10|nr:SAM-dependent methyltransferase [Mycobacteroides chelonae]